MEYTSQNFQPISNRGVFVNHFIKPLVTLSLPLLALFSAGAFALTCPDSYHFSCKAQEGTDKTRCEITDSKVSAEWTFSAPSRYINPSNLSAGDSPNDPHVSESILRPGDYIAKYRFSYSGMVTGLPGDNNGYCFYVLNTDLSFAGLYSVEYEKAANNPELWTRRENGELCQAGGRCIFVRKK
jgi:hypothetical protein